MFIAAMSMIAKLWEEPRCPSIDEWIKKRWYIYTMDYYSAIKKNEILPFATTWMELEDITLSEINQSEKDKYHMFHSYMEFKKQNKRAKEEREREREKPRNRLLTIQNQPVVTSGESTGGIREKRLSLIHI